VPAFAYEMDGTSSVRSCGPNRQRAPAVEGVDVLAYSPFPFGEGGEGVGSGVRTTCRGSTFDGKIGHPAAIFRERGEDLAETGVRDLSACSPFPSRKGEQAQK
jgi:hypothetical protein